MDINSLEIRSVGKTTYGYAFMVSLSVFHGRWVLHLKDNNVHLLTSRINGRIVPSDWEYSTRLQGKS